MYPIVQKLTDLFNEAVKIHDIPSAEMYHRQLQEYVHMNPMDDDNDPLYSGLDPNTIDYAKQLNDVKNQAVDNTNLSLNKMWVTAAGTGLSGLINSSPGQVIPSNTLGNTVTFRSVVHPMATLREPTIAEKEADKRRHLKLFVHFATEFVKRYPKWTVVPDEADPLHSVHLLMKERGAMIHNLYPSNEMAVYGGPASWTDPRKELGQHLPIVKINTQEFWGWCVGMDDVPEWMVE